MPIGTAFISDPYIVEGISASRLLSMRDVNRTEPSKLPHYNPRQIIQMYDDDASFTDWQSIDKQNQILQL